MSPRNAGLSVRGELNPQQLQQVREAIKRADLPQKKRQRLVLRIGRGIISTARRHARAQQDPDGKPWAPRAGQRRKKLLRKLPGWLVQQGRDGGDATLISFKRGGKTRAAGLIARLQHEGISATVNRSAVRTGVHHSQARAPDSDIRQRPASVRQRRALKRAGYTLARNQSISMLQAGAIIRRLRGQAAKTRWQIRVPPRQFLGVSDADISKIIARELHSIQYGYRVAAQDLNRR